ncbi:hypothetical protein STSP2_02322 [Anaerohalosphaera lusitana]|uniref:Ice-binding protein C-terminal domain-containing protein n=1 Tax=Anaerohalosphaera lusitana TaxID=1936003 RepID=A0A1U9NMS7_9BACT|nr:PEP-CTERM sorting domain-containing protein [Anaerohalosphaera lusitana]AQT69135.1 hypothetical protein STSP2_02322 [Anaerohalosphaera lusitana]
MKKILALCLLVAVCGSVQANLLPNASFEDWGTDVNGWDMPNGGYGLWTEDWGGLGSTGICTGDAQDGSVSFKLEETSWSAGALTYGLGQLGTTNGLGWYHVGGFVKASGTTPVDATIGIDIFAPDWSAFWWGGGADVVAALNSTEGQAGEWVYVGFDFEVTDPTANYNFRVKTDNGSFLVDNVQLVPEPASMALLGLGSLLALRRRK